MHSASTMAKPEIKKELIELFTDPHEAYHWKTDSKAYRWDGKETLNTVAANIIRKAIERSSPNRSIFFLFPHDHASKGHRHGTTRANKTINEALDIALRLQMSERDEVPASNTVDFGFEPASMHDRLKILELEMKSLSTKIEGTQGVKEEKSQGKTGRDNERSSKIDKYNSPTDRSRGRSESRNTRRDDRREYSSGRDRYRDFNCERD
jgi:hypothetical protein